MAGPSFGAEMTGVSALSESIDDITMRWATDFKLGVGSDVSYAAHVEFGTHKMKAQPYLRPAIEHVKRTLGKQVKKSGADSLEEVAEIAGEQIKDYAQDVVPVDTGTLRASIQVYELDSSGNPVASASHSISL